MVIRRFPIQMKYSVHMRKIRRLHLSWVAEIECPNKALYTDAHRGQRPIQQYLEIVAATFIHLARFVTAQGAFSFPTK